MATDLKPCPFCGSEDCVILRHIGRWHDDHRTVCDGCGASTARMPTPEHAADRWNRRIGDHDEQEEEAAQEADREPEEEGEVEEESRNLYAKEDCGEDDDIPRILRS